MESSLSETARASLYQALAEVLDGEGPPEWLSLPGPEWPLAANVRPLAQSSPAVRQFLARIENIPPEEAGQRRERHRNLFAAPGKPRFWLYESMHFSGRVLGPQMAEVERWYREMGLEPAGAELPDHASVELAFLAYLAARRAAFPALEVQFLRSHAGRWLPDLGRALVRSDDPVYAPVGGLLAGWIEENLGLGRSSLPKSPGIPVVFRPEDCTLCGFCSQVCPVRAIVVNENECETWLELDSASCSGCGWCVTACEFGALELQDDLVVSLDPNPFRPLASSVLVKSPRAACRGCGQAMVSTAELRYVASQLGDPSWLHLCEGCRASRVEVPR